MGFLSTTIDVQRSDIVQRLKRCPESTVSMTAHGAKLQTNCGNPNWLCVFHRSKTHIHGTNFYRKTARQPVVRLFAPYGCEQPAAKKRFYNGQPSPMMAASAEATVVVQSLEAFMSPPIQRDLQESNETPFGGSRV